MNLSVRKGYTLRFTLSVLVIISVFLTAFIGSYTAINANVKSLTSSYLLSNYDYAKKLSSYTTELLGLMQMNVDALSKMTKHFSQSELDLWFAANEYFNSIVIVDANRIIKAISPGNAGVQVGTRLTSEPSLKAIELKKPFVSEPYKAASGRLILLVSSPIFNADGTYAGFVGGTIYLEEDNALSRLLKEHYFGNGSYVYVVDRNNRIIFHPRKERINAVITSNAAVSRVVSGESGYGKIVNSEGKPFFAGFAFEPSTGWGIVSQTPTSVLQEPVKRLVIQVLLQALPLLILILLLVWWVANRISKPLYMLAKFSEEAILHKKTVPPKLPAVSSWIYEVKQLYQSINTHLNLLHTEIQMDGLTGIANRKTFDLIIKEWKEKNKVFSLILLDVDHFKSVNDTYGHVTGDEVLKYVASAMRSLSRAEDLCFRYGGEEFGILLNGQSLDIAENIAERLRKQIAKGQNATGEVITISIGISFSDANTKDVKEIIEKADSALYKSKIKGRNKTTIYA